MTTAAATNTVKKAKKQPEATPPAFGLGLDNIGDLSGLLNQPAPGGSGYGPLDLPLDLVSEDPHQPRTKDNPGFSSDSLAELADTISLRGVKTPISVRDNPEAPGFYIINHGARRTRASKLAGKTSIPAFIDNDYNEADQVIENLQRNDLTPREIADFIGRELAKGKQKGEIAKELGKSASFVSQHVTLLDLPEPIAVAFNTGRCRDVTVINELVTAHKKRPKEVGVWLADESQEIARGSVKLLREFLEDKRKHEHIDRVGDDGDNAPDEAPDTHFKAEAENDETTGSDQSPGGSEDTREKASGEANPHKLKKAIVQVRHDDRPARLILNRRPPATGFALLKYEDDGQEFVADLSQVQLVALVEG
ncbi:MAG TPA: chromosome partitioning protein ParB [Candidatus Accumulibacter sp.]|nr:chromosome partitioning protein ParB [Accumulibacter sp.]